MEVAAEAGCVQLAASRSGTAPVIVFLQRAVEQKIHHVSLYFTNGTASPSSLGASLRVKTDQHFYGDTHITIGTALLIAG